MKPSIVRPAEVPGLELFLGTVSERGSVHHLHDEYRFGVSLSGAWQTRYGGASYMVAPGALQLAQPGVTSSCDMGDEPQTVLAITCPATILREVTGGVANNHSRDPWFPDHIVLDPSAAERLISVYQSIETPETRLDQMEALYSLCGYVIGRFSQTVGRLPIMARRAGVSRVKQRIDDEPAADPSLEELASLAGMSKFHFTRAFTAEVGISPRAYIIHRRIESAKVALARRGESTDLALQLGFYDQSHFIRHFKRRIGLSPRAYASILRN